MGEMLQNMGKKFLESTHLPRQIGRRALPKKPAPERECFMLTQSSRLVLQTGDLTAWEGDAIVNAANEMMLGGGGVDGAIHRRAGPDLRKACKEHPEVRPGCRCPTGEARITPGFRLPAKYVIHTVGPIYTSAERSEPLLTKAFESSLELANLHSLKTIAFPAISCGVFGYPLDEAAKVSLTSARDNVGSLEEIHFVLFERCVWDAFLGFATTTFERLMQPGTQATTSGEPNGNEEESGEMSETSEMGQGPVAADMHSGTSEGPSGQSTRELEGTPDAEMDTDGDKKSAVAENTANSMEDGTQDAIEEKLLAEKDVDEDEPTGDGIQGPIKNKDDPMQVCVQDSANEATPDEGDGGKGDNQQENIQDSANEVFGERDGDSSVPKQSGNSPKAASIAKADCSADAHPKDEIAVVLDGGSAVEAATYKGKVSEAESSKEVHKTVGASTDVNVCVNVTVNGHVNLNVNVGSP